MDIQTRRIKLPLSYLPTTPVAGAPSPLAVWQFDGGVSALLDRTGNGYDLSVDVGSANYAEDEYGLGFVGFRFDANRRLVAPDQEALRIAKDSSDGGSAALTVEMILRVTNTDTAHRLFCCYADGESDTTNYLYELQASKISGYWLAFNERGSGSNLNINFTDALVPSTDTGMIYVVMTVSADGKTRRLYINGSLVAENSAVLESQKGVSGNLQRLRFGGTTTYTRGWLWSARVTAGVYSSDNVLDAWEEIASEKLMEVDGVEPEQIVDRLALLPAGGEDQHSPQLAGGERVPVLPVGVEDRLIADVLGRGDRLFEEMDASGLSDEAILKLGAVVEFNPYTPTTDPDGHVHLETSPVYQFSVYDARDDAWNIPNGNPSFTGYGRGGTHFTAGIQDAGPVYAPWYTEGEFGNAHRSTRQEFPLLSLIAVSATEVIIYDLDNYPTALPMWMRWQRPQSTSYYFHGRGPSAIRDVKMVNGVLYTVADYNSSYSAANGHLTATDFKIDGSQDAHWMIRSDWSGRLLSGKDITDRNTTSWSESSGSLRMKNERCTRLDVHVDPDDHNRVWCAVGGEDTWEVIEFYGNIPQRDYLTTPAPTDNIEDRGARGVAFDASGQLWCYERVSDGETRVFRNGLDYQGGVIPDPFNPLNGDLTRRRYPMTTIPAGAFAMVAARQSIFIGTRTSIYEKTTGVWVIDRSTLEKKLAYTIVDGSGVGAAGLQGEVLAGSKQPEYIRVWNQRKTSYLMVASHGIGGGVTIIRLRDDQVMLSRIYNTLQEDGSYIVNGFVI